jgi:hypothetical protein
MIEKIRLRSGATSDEGHVPNSIRQTTQYLLKMLRIEYEKTNYIAGSSTAPEDVHTDCIELQPEWMSRFADAREAVVLLKDQLCLFIKKSYPFNHPCLRDDNPQAW